MLLNEDRALVHTGLYNEQSTSLTMGHAHLQYAWLDNACDEAKYIAQLHYISNQLLTVRPTATSIVTFSKH